MSLRAFFLMMSVCLWAGLPPVRAQLAYTVRGEVRDSSANGKVIYIMRYDDSKMIDSTVVEDNRFVFTGESEEPAFCRIDITMKEFGNFILDAGEIRLNTSQYNRPSGTSLNEEMAFISAEEDSLRAVFDSKIEALHARYPDDEAFEHVYNDSLLHEIRAVFAERGKMYFARHNDDVIGNFLVYTPFMQEVGLEQQETFIESFGPWLKSRERVKDMQLAIENQRKTAEGKPFVDIRGVDESGNPVTLSDFVGKGNYVLMDMWASWCGPCRGELPNLAALHGKYRDKGLTVVGIFVWDKAANLHKAVEEENVTWPQIINEEADGMQAMESYGVDWIPFIVLFAPDGTILKRNLQGENMIRIVDDIMNHK